MTNQDGDLVDKTVDGQINAYDNKATPVDADVIPGEDSATSYAKIRFTWANIKATLKTYFDALYATAGDIATAISTHAGLPSVHHAKYLDSEAVNAMGAKGDGNPLNHDKYTDAEAIAAPDPLHNESLGLSTYTGTIAFQPKTSVALTVDGTYIVSASFQLGGSDSGIENQAELHDAAAQLVEHTMVPYKKYNEGAGKNHFPSNSLMAKVVISGTPKTISLRYATTNAGKTVAIQNASIYARRIA